MLSLLGDDQAIQISLQVIPIRNLREAVSLLEGETHLNPPRIDLCDLFAHRPDHEPDFANVKAQASIKRALDLAAAGSNDVLLLSPVLHSRPSPGGFFICPIDTALPSASPAALLTAPAGHF